MDYEDDIEIEDEDDARQAEFHLCLCGREPTDEDVITEMGKAVALRLRYGVVMDGCLYDVVDVYDEIHASLKIRAARELDKIASEISASMVAARLKERSVMERTTAGHRLH